MLSHRLLAGRQRRRVVVVKVLEPKPKPLLDLGEQRLRVDAGGGRRGGDLGDLGGLLAEAGEQVGELGLRLRELRPEDSCSNCASSVSFSFECALLRHESICCCCGVDAAEGAKASAEGEGEAVVVLVATGKKELAAAGAVWIQK